MVSQKKALECVETLIQFCNEQRSCQNCIFRLFGADHWNCHIDCFDLQDIMSNIQAKRKNHGYI